MFRAIEINDKKIFDEFKIEGYYGSELNFANIYAWKEFDELTIYNDEHMLIIKGKDFFFPPLVKEIEYINGINFIKLYCLKNNFPFNIYGLTKEFAFLFSLDDIIVYEHRELNEYVYETQSLLTYQGKKLHAKRNLLNQFQNRYNYQFVAYEEKYRNEIISLIDLWTEKKSLTFEKKGILSLLDNLNFLECYCDCIIIDNKVQAFSIGTIFNNVGIVLFEKANTEYIGIYAAIVNLFANKHFANCKLINRQEDMGLENLRQSKLSYHPLTFVYKYQITSSYEQQLKQIYKANFLDSEEYIDYFFHKKEKEVYFLTKNNLIVSSLYFRKQDLIFQGKIIKAYFIFALSTHPLYQHQGYMKELLTNFMNKVYDEVDVIYLHPAIKNFYEQFGFVYFGITPQETKEYEKDSLYNIEKLLSLYNEYAKQFSLFTYRTKDDFTKIIDEIKIDNGKVAILKEHHQDIGYLIEDDNSVIEYCNLKEVIPYNNTYNMLRIINLESFLKKIDYSLTENVVDNIITKNSTSSLNQISIADITKKLMNNINSLTFDKY